MYEINYDDERFQDIEKEKQNAINESDEMYRGMIEQSDDYYQKQIDETRKWMDEQTELQQGQTDLTLKQIEQQKEQAEKDYTKEQKASYVDWQKESNKYGANAEQMAGQGMANSGYAESSQVSMYNTYQNRVATARESWERAKVNYDNAMTEARLQNSATLAEIAYKGLQQELELSLQSFQYQNELLVSKASAKAQILGRADSQYQAVLQQMNTENALNESIRQFDVLHGNNPYKSGDGNGEEKNKFLQANNMNIYPASVSTYEKAVAYLQRNGVPASGLMTKNEWYRRKGSGGTGQEMVFDDYEEYLLGFVNWVVQQQFDEVKVE